MSDKRRGRKPKAQRNISGLRNHKILQEIDSKEQSVNPIIEETPVNQRTTDGQEDPNVKWDLMICLDSMRPEWEKEDQEEEDLEQGKVGDSDVASFTEGWDNEDANMYGDINLPISTFADAKKAALEALDQCPSNVIDRFINRSWRFVLAHQVGLKGNAAAWAMHKYKGHHTILRAALMHIEALAPPV
ncbi:hypothetical protein E4T56_gene11520 [Termitomyces sp. T112]|nr:hypothetical protein E4T56_gene11520 [Termitomyces sp. T112]